MKRKNIIQNYLLPVLSIPIITAAIFIPFNLDEISEFLTMVIPLMWVIISILYLLIYTLIFYFISNPIFKIIISLGCSYLVIGQLFKIMHWPGSTTSMYIGLGLIVLAIMFLIRSNKLKPKQEK